VEEKETSVGALVGLCPETTFGSTIFYHILEKITNYRRFGIDL